jgi:hypothetical protein
MKKIVKISSLAILLTISAVMVFAQCPPEALVKKCSGKLGDFMFLKSFKIEKASEDVEYSYVFTSNTSYLISLGNNTGSDATIEVNVYDSARKLVMSNKLKDKVYPTITYSCKATGIYYMTYTIKDGTCGVSVVGFKKM